MIREMDVVCFSRHGTLRCLSNSFECEPFLIEFPEHFYQEPREIWSSIQGIFLFMALLFCDIDSFNRLSESKNLHECLCIGRQIVGFDKYLWEEYRDEYAFYVILAKFSSCKKMQKTLLGTGSSILAEAAVHDCTWGIGLSLSDPSSKDPSQWRGTNLLGNILMQVREHLRSDL